jgi:hypothetical protein
MVERFEEVKQPTNFKPVNGIVKDGTLRQGALLIISSLVQINLSLKTEFIFTRVY